MGINCRQAVVIGCINAVKAHPNCVDQGRGERMILFNGHKLPFCVRCEQLDIKRFGRSIGCVVVQIRSEQAVLLRKLKRSAVTQTPLESSAR